MYLHMERKKMRQLVKANSMECYGYVLKTINQFLSFAGDVNFSRNWQLLTQHHSLPVAVLGLGQVGHCLPKLKTGGLPKYQGHYNFYQIFILRQVKIRLHELPKDVNIGQTTNYGLEIRAQYKGIIDEIGYDQQYSQDR